jgi:membrane protein implicated in regulation of membrane protease activity
MRALDIVLRLLQVLLGLTIFIGLLTDFFLWGSPFVQLRVEHLGTLIMMLAAALALVTWLKRRVKQRSGKQESLKR